jgi:transcriptional regulator with XRE-family HTH domain
MVTNMADAAWFAGRLRELREQAGLSRQELADKAGLSVYGIRDIEQGINQPSWPTVLSIAEALGVDCTVFTQPPAERESPGPGRPPKAKQEELKPEPPKKRKKK